MVFLSMLDFLIVLQVKVKLNVNVKFDRIFYSIMSPWQCPMLKAYADFAQPLEMACWAYEACLRRLKIQTTKVIFVCPARDFNPRARLVFGVVSFGDTRNY